VRPCRPCRCRSIRSSVLTLALRKRFPSLAN